MVKFYIDPGHGGKDPGAVGNDIHEADIVLSIAKEIGSLLENNYENVEVKLSRTTDKSLSLEERTKEANLWKADCYVSIHNNAHTNPLANGFETFVYPNASKSTAFQNVMHKEILAEIKDFKIVDRGKKTANFHVLRESAMTALLSENLFISNRNDAALLKQDKFIKAVAKGHVNGFVRFYGLKEKKATPTPNPPTRTDTLYQVVVGNFADRDNAERRVKELKTKGYDSYIQLKE